MFLSLSARRRRESNLSFQRFLSLREDWQRRRKKKDFGGEGKEREAKPNWFAVNAETPGEKWWGIVKGKAVHIALLEVEENTAQQHLLLQLNVSEVTSTKRMPPEGGENKQSVRTSWQLEKNNRTIKQYHWEHWMAAPASSSSLFKACRKNNKRCYKEKTNLRQSEQQWDWPEGIVVRAGFLKLREHIGASRSSWLYRHAFCLQK